MCPFEYFQGGSEGYERLGSFPRGDQWSVKFGEEDGKRKRWADCVDEDVKERQEGQDAEKEERRAGEREDEVKGEEETRKEETTDEKPPGLEDVENEPKTQEEEKQSRVESEQGGARRGKVRSARGGEESA